MNNEELKATGYRNPVKEVSGLLNQIQKLEAAILYTYDAAAETGRDLDKEYIINNTHLIQQYKEEIISIKSEFPEFFIGN